MSEVIGTGVFEAASCTYTTFLMSKCLTMLIDVERGVVSDRRMPAITSDVRYMLRTLRESNRTRPSSLSLHFGEPTFRNRLRYYEQWLRKRKWNVPLAAEEDRQIATALRDLLDEIHKAGVDQMDIDRVNDLEPEEEDRFDSIYEDALDAALLQMSDGKAKSADATRLHKEAMELARDAEEDPTLFQHAFLKEKLALEAWELDTGSAQPTFGILCRSAATLAFRGNLLNIAKELISLGLNSSPPTFVEKELRELSERIEKHS